MSQSADRLSKVGPWLTFRRGRIAAVQLRKLEHRPPLLPSGPAALIGDDGEKPGTHAIPPAEACNLSPGQERCFLDGVLRRGAVVEHGPRHPVCRVHEWLE